MLLIFFVVGWQVVTSRQFRPDGRLFVIVIGVPTLLLTVLLMASAFSARVHALFDRLSSDLIEIDDVSEMVGEDESTDEVTARSHVLRISVWIAVVTLLVALFGILPSILVFLIAFYLVETDLGPVRSVGYAGAIWVGILVVFVELLNTRFYRGIFDIMSYLPYP